MRVVIDLTKTNFANPVGVDRYALAMTKALTEGHPEVEWVVLTKKDIWPSFFSTQVGVALATWKDRKIDVLWSPVPTMPILRRFGLKTVVTIHDLEGSKWSTRWSLKLADRVVAVSEATRKQVIDRVGATRGSPEFAGRSRPTPTDKITTILEGVDTAMFYPHSADEVNTVKTRLGITGDYFLFVGTVGPRKNVEGLIRGFHKYCQTDKLTNCQLIIAGSVNDIYRNILRLPATLGIAERVNFLGRVGDNDLPAIYSGALATCLVSYDEGFGLPVLESLACGRPVVVSNRGIMPELAGPAGVVVDPTSITSISDGLRQVAQIDSYTCRSQAEKYSWGSAADKLVSLLSTVGAGSPSPSSLTVNGRGNRAPTYANILGVKVNSISFNATLRQISQFVTEPHFHLVTTVNPEFILTAGKDSEFKEILNKADLSLPDGIGVVLALRFRRGDIYDALNLGKLLGCDESRPYGTLQRVAGADLVPALVKLAAEKGWSVGFLGGEDFKGQDVCQLVKQHFLTKYPSLNVAYCSREATPELFNTELDLLFVAFGAPKQEKFLWSAFALSDSADATSRLATARLANVRVGIGVGGTFDFIVGKQKRAPLLCQKVGLEGLWRLFVEPKRWKRVFRAYIVFPIKFCLSLL